MATTLNFIFFNFIFFKHFKLYFLFATLLLCDRWWLRWDARELGHL